MKGDLLELAEAGEFDVVIHGCNCYGNMDGGIARAIKRRFPAAHKVDQESAIGDANKLGGYTSAQITLRDHSLEIINAYTQLHWKGSGVLVDYNAVASVFRLLKGDFGGSRIGYPRIGAGLARGDWEIISHIIDEALEGEDHTLVEYVRQI